VTNADTDAIVQCVSALYQVAETSLRRTFPRPALSFRRSGKHAGTAYLQQNRLNFHPLLFSHNKEAYFNDVIPHEISHLLVYQLYGRVKPHGKEWQAIMEQVFKREAKTTHQFDLTPLNIKSFNYTCGCSTIALSVRRHNKVTRGQQLYRCRKCGEILTEE
jgi:SprT protein